MAEPEIVAADLVRGWRVERRRGTAADLHDAEVRPDVEASVWICEPLRPALVLGSTQRDLVVPPGPLERGGIDLVRRRSGGGAVLLLPGRSTWIDFVIPVGHSLWDADVGRATHWVGDTMARALTSSGIESVPHRGAMRPSDWSRLVCFAGLGPGEVVDPRGRKLVGLSQRRTRHAARFQTVLYHRGEPSEIVDLLGLGAPEAEQVAAVLEAGARSVAVDPDAFVEALLGSLPLSR
ncbi:MAG: hypothetical protein U5K29_01060 [Acidimicrobiales bacterium]|nr:hypothetical protein [Acidimicrobiales bacterium]